MRPVEATKPNDYLIHEKPACIAKSGFFDPDDVDNPEAEVAIILRRTIVDDEEWFELERPIGYWDAHLGSIVVPGPTPGFLTDLTSVPQLLTWLIPRTGSHLPAALIHDGLIPSPCDDQTYIATNKISRTDADRIFRDAMRDVDTPPLSRWLIWTAVAAATKVHATNDDLTLPQLSNTGSRWSPLGWLVVLGTIISIVTMGTLATLEILDCIDLIPALRDKSTVVEFGIGTVAAVAIPSLISATWYREWRAGIMAGVAVAMLLHVMVAILVVFGVFRAMDNVSGKNFKASAIWLAVSVATCAGVAALVAAVC